MTRDRWWELALVAVLGSATMYQGASALDFASGAFAVAAVAFAWRSRSR